MKKKSESFHYMVLTFETFHEFLMFGALVMKLTQSTLTGPAEWLCFEH